MRTAALPLSALLLASAAPPPDTAPSPETMLPGYSDQAHPWRAIADGAQSACRDRIEQVREEAGQPRLDRQTADASRPLMIAAVDKRIDDCAVMQMKGDVNDLRPLPQPSPGPARLQPAR